MTATAVIDGGVECRHESGAQRVTILGDGIAEIRVTQADTLSEKLSYALDPEGELGDPGPIRVVAEGDHVDLRAKAFMLSLAKSDGRIDARKWDGMPLVEDAAPVEWAIGPAAVTLRKRLRPGERLLGLGDKAAGVDRRGHRVRHWNTDAYGFQRGSDPLYKTIPFILGIQKEGTPYGLFVDSFAPSVFDLGYGDEAELQISVEADDITYYLIHGDTPIDVIERYAALTGRTPMVPRWALGYHQCRYSYKNEEEMRRVAAEFRRRRIPCDTLYFDIHYMDDFRVFTWDEEAFPDPEGLIRDLNGMGFTTVAIVDPGIASRQPLYPVARDGLDQDVFVRRVDGSVYEGPVWPGMCHFPDFHRPEVRTWWATHLGTLLDTGVDGIWCDMNEPSVFIEEVTGKNVARPDRTIPDGVLHVVHRRRTPHRQAHNAYGQQMHRATFEGMLRHRPKRRPFVITRAAYAGSQRFGATWTGDNSASWKHLRLGLEQLLSLNVSGFPFCGTDIGGFSGTPSPELLVRWTQVGVLSPLFRNHSAVDTPRQEPWLFGDKVEDACRKAIELRYRLMPYLYTLLHRAATRGTPMILPLDVLHPDDTFVAEKRPAGVYLGDSLLAYPVVHARRRSVRAYLPDVPGGWYDFHSGEHLEPGLHRVAAPLDRLPLFVKAGSVVPISPVVESTSERADQPLILRVYPRPGPFDSHLYDDAGDGYDFEAGAYISCHFHGEGGPNRLDLTPSLEGTYTPRWRSWRFEVLQPGEVSQAIASGRPVPFDRAPGSVAFEVPVGAAISLL